MNTSAIEPLPLLPVSFAQQRLWFLAQLDTRANTAYHISGGVRLRGALDLLSLRAALDRIVERHEVLRTSLVATKNGRPRQKVLPHARFPLVHETLSDRPDPQGEAEGIAQHEAALPFDLDRGPLIRGRLLRLAAEDHVLLVTMHHAVSDGWSMGVLLKELSALYAAFKAGRHDPLPPLAIQYADYAIWQRKRLKGEVLEEQTGFWRKALRGAPALLELPTDRPRPAVQDYAGARLAFELDAELSAQVTAWSRRHRCTLFMTLLAAWAALLSRLSGQKDVVIGTPVAGRTRPEMEPLIGFFVNTLALRINLNGTPTVAELLQRVRHTTLAAQDHQELPFEHVIEAVQPMRSLGHNPLFQVMFTVENTGNRGDLEMPGLDLEAAHQEAPTAKFDLALSLHESDGRIVGQITYATALFDTATITRHIDHYTTLVRAMASTDAQVVERLPLLCEQEQFQVLQEWNATEAAFPAGRRSTLHKLLEEQAHRTPEATAVVFEGGTISYAELDAHANRLSHRLIALGVRPGTCVALALPRSAELVAAVLAVLKCGAAYVPLDLEHPAERLRFMLADCQARLLVCHHDCALDMLPRLDVAPFDGNGPCAPPGVAVHAEGAAYVMYTSGSTGTPKGVVVPHRAVVNFALNPRHALLRPSDRVAFVANAAFDASTFEIWAPLLHGAALVVIDQATLLEPQALAQRLHDTHVTVVHLTAGLLPSHASALAAMPPRKETPGQPQWAQPGPGGAHLRYLLTGGDRVDAAAVAHLLASGSFEHLIHCYGPTETTTFATTHEVCDIEPGAHSIPIGRPIANARVYILDAHGAAMPVGVAGEIHIGGVGVAIGYLNRPDLTAERFVPDPFAPQPGVRMYRTGDLGRWRSDGTIEFLGRNDLQIKLRGLRIEPGEIESRLVAHPHVREAVVLAREDAHGDKRLVAYLTGEGSLSPEALRAHLATHLPEYMVPAAYVQLDAWPLTPHGKLDRRALPAPEGDAFGTRAYEAPQGELETTLAAIWSELLGVERIGRHDNFFGLGGHSLMATRLMSRIRMQLGLEVPLAELFAQPMLAGFAKRAAAAGASTLPAIVPASRAEPLPLSFAQQRLWFIGLQDHARAAYVIATGVRLRGALDVPAMQAALDRLVARHEALRTRFASAGGTPIQIIATDAGFALEQLDLSGRADPEAALERLAEEEAGAPFDLERGPLIRGRLLRLAADDHALLVSMHHIVSDGWSSGVLLNEFSALYTACSQGRPNPLPPLAIQYADYAVWQRRWITGAVLQRQLAFWRDNLSGAPARLELPTDRPRPPVQDYAGSALGFEFDAPLSAGLKALSRRHGTTLFMTLIASWAALLARLSGQDKVVIGTPVAHRTRGELEPLIGCFVNSLALCIDLSGDPTVAELLAQVRATALAAQAHQDIPFEQVVEALNPVRSTAHGPVFQVMFAWQNTPEGALDLPGLQLEPVGVPATSAQFDLEVSMHEAGEHLGGSLGYATALFGKSTIERHLALWQRLLHAWAASDTALVPRLPLLSEEERHQLLHGYNATQAALPHLCLHQLFEATVARTPEAVALVGDDATLSYAELNSRANRLAHHLCARGVGPDDRVAICVERGVPMMVGLLAILKAGGGYVALDAAYPAERLAYMLADSAPRVLLTQARLHAALPACSDVIDLDDPDAWQHCPDSNPAPGLIPAHLAYVIYTSGSTGTPKGVQVEHASVVNYALAAAGIYALSPADRVLQTSSISFDIAVDEIFTTLATGATLVLPPWPRLPSIAEFSALIERQRLTVLNLPTAYWHEWVAALGGDPAPLPPALRLVVVGGEAASASRLQQWRALAGEHVTWLNSYGPTETTAGVTFGPVGADEPMHIGAPIANTRIYILDAWGQPVPVGVPGELRIGGVQVARGYLNRPELTAERFVPDPYGPPGARLYKTGDLGRWRADGTLECLGRNDEQVKIRGFRIEPGEIQARLLDHPDVREAVVLAREAASGERRLVAYVLGEEASPEALREHLARQLPEYMVPAAYVRLDGWPLTPNGKLDRRALPAPQDDAYGARRFEPPQGELESALDTLWRELLGVERVGRHDDFFELGGHSLLAVQLAARIRARMGVDVEVADLFTHTTLAAFAQCVAAADAAELPAIVPASHTEPPPLSFAQQRLWFLARLNDSARNVYLVPGGVRLRGTLDVPALEAALARIVERHEALRTSFNSVDGRPVQVIAPPCGLPLAHIDLSGHPDATSEVERLAQVEATEPFDLARGPLIRARLLRLAEHDHVLLVTMHHIVSDGWSMGVLVNELSALYAAFAQGRPDPLPPLAVQYADYAVWQRQRITGEVLQRQLAFWRDHLSGAPSLLELPTDRPRPAEQDHAGASLDFVLDAELTTALKDLSHQHGTTLFMTLLASWAALLARLSGQDDVVIGTPVANRHRAEVEPLIGFFVNTQALRVHLSGKPTVAELLAQVRTTALAAQAHQDIPFEQVVEALNPPRRLAHSPVFQVLMAWQNAPEGTLELPSLQLQAVGAKAHTAKFDLDVSLEEAGDVIVGSFQYASALFDAPTIERHLVHWRTLLRAMAADAAQAVGRLPLLSPEERRQLVQGCNAAGATFPVERCIHELFEDQVRRTPEAIAVAFEDTSVTYAELNSRANRLAHHLIALGITPDTCAALALPRGVDMLVALLATLKAGGAYVPLDPAYPLERLAFALADSAPRVLLTTTGIRAALGTLPPSLAMLELDAAIRPWERHCTTNPDFTTLGRRPSHLAYIIYTSGSTGTPKGVMVEHSQLVRLFSSTQRWFNFGADDVWTLFHSYAFDFSVWELWGALLHGGRLVVVPQLTTRSPREFYALLCDQGVTVLNQTPSAFRQLIAAQAQSDEPHRLRCVIFGGEALEPATLAPWYERNGERTQLINMYGITETTVHVTYRPLTPQDTRRSASPIGVRIPDLRVLLLDAHGQPVPVGVAGELYVGGAGVARGYLNRPALTAERFVPDPFAAEAGIADARMYKTGDLGRWLIDNNGDATIEFLGRNDQQIKIRGFRIEPGEIEVRLLELPGVREAVVHVREDAPGDKRLVAYVTGEGALHPEAMRAHLDKSLPEYMVPAAYVQLHTLPLTPNGKLDRRALPAPEDGAFGTRDWEAPRGDLETTLAAIWGTLLGIERIGRQDNFFALGGHSLLAISLIERMGGLGWQLSVRSLFTSPTLAGLAASIQAHSALRIPPNLIDPDCTRLTPELLPLVQLSQSEIDLVVDKVPGGLANVQDIYPLAPLQEGILFHHLLSPEGDTYLNPSVLAFDSRERLDRFVAALQAVIDRHDILRTAIVWHGLSEPVQVVWRRARLPVEDLALEGDDIAAQLLARLDPRHTRIELHQAPLLRAHVTHDARHNRWLLCLLSHHIVGDHTSLEVMVAEVQAHLAGQARRLPQPVPFRNFVAQARLGLTREQHEAFFREMLADIDEPTAPFGLLDVNSVGSELREARLPLDIDLARQVRGHARRLGVSVASLFHLAWALVLARTSGRDDVVFGTVLFGRMQGGEAADRVLGLFMNTLPIRLRVDDTAAEQAVRATHELLAQLLHHEHAPLALAQRCSAVPAPQPLFSALLNYRHAPGNGKHDEDTSTSGQDWERIELLYEDDRSNYPFSLDIDDHGERFTLTAQVRGPLDARRVCDFVQRALHGLVQALEETSALPLCQLDVLPVEERHRMLMAWNDTEARYPRDSCVHELFERREAEQPEAMAVVQNETCLSYRQLNEQANRLAHHLIARGVKADQRVAICMERSSRMVVGLLAILKAGGAYLPLDPAYPAERLAFMLADSAPVALLTDGQVRASVQKNLSGVPGLCIIDVAADSADWSTRPATNPVREVTGVGPRALAYVMYTSGSTGQPKGVMVEHRGVCNQVTALQRRYDLHPGDRLLQFASVNFDGSVEEIFGALLSGASLVLRTDAWLADAAGFYALCEQQQVSVINLPTQFWQHLVRDGRTPIPECTRTMIITGEAVSAASLAAWFQRPGHRPALFNAYGPTEVTVNATLHEPQADDASSQSIGRPLANMTIYLLDAHGHPVPQGVPGEICVGGVGVARGYLNRPDLTAQNFVADPFAAPGARMYRTGDLGRWLADGTIEFLGRRDHQIKVRGFRIELSEIEVHLLALPQVHNAVVLARDDSLGHKRLVAYVTGKVSLEPEALRQHLAACLPEYMVPAAYVHLDVLPLTPNGKLDRHALPAPQDDALRSNLNEAPRHGIEQALAKIWSQVLGVAQISREDHFFELGGHSLLAVRLVSVAVQRGFNLGLHDVYAHPTLSSLAECLAGGAQATGPCALVARRSGSALPVFAVPTGTGDIIYAFELAAHLDAEVPVYALPWPEQIPRSMEALAARMVELMRAVRPHGPYRLLGYSSGGLLAYAIAQHLAELDEPVDFVGLLDCDHPSMSPLRTTRDEHVKASLLGQVAELAQQEKYRHQEELQKAVRELEANAQDVSLPDFVALCEASGALRALAAQEQTSIAQFAASCARSVEYDALWPAYLARPLPSLKLHVFRASDEAPGDELLGWDRLLAREQIEIHAVPGTHSSMVEPPHIPVLGRTVSESLRSSGIGSHTLRHTPGKPL